MNSNTCKYCGKSYVFIVGRYQQPSCNCEKLIAGTGSSINRWRWAIYNLNEEETSKINEMEWSLYKEPFTGTIYILGKRGEHVMVDPSEEELKLMIDFCYQFGYHKGKGFSPITLASSTPLKQPIM